MIKFWRKQFASHQLSLSHDNRLVFVKCQWQKDSKASAKYLIYRCLIALYFLITWILSIVDLSHSNEGTEFRIKYIIYLTNWGYILCTVQAIVSVVMLSCCVLADRLRSHPNLQENALKTYKLYWLTNTIGTNVAFGITTLYWSLVYRAENAQLDAMNIIVHVNNSIVMMIDLMMVSHPMSLLHCCYTLVFGFCYAVFTVIYYSAGGLSRNGTHYIYKILDWNDPTKATIATIAAIALLIVVHIFTWAIFKFRSWIYDKYFLPKKNANAKQIDSEQMDKVAYDNVIINNDLV